MLFRRVLRRIKANKEAADSTILLDCTREVCAERTGFGFAGAVVSDVGRVRANNEDNYVLGKHMNDHSADNSKVSVSFSSRPDMWQFAGVFDGMGGGDVGELASHDTAKIFQEAFEHLTGSPSGTEVDLCVRKAFLAANNRIVDLQNEYKVFGTTGTVLASNGVVFKIYHLGDSRAYLVREGGLIQLTKDQTLAQMKIDVGIYTEDSPWAEADKHKLTDYIGRDKTGENIKPVENGWIPVQKDDCVLLCSDGLYDMCKNEEILEILLHSAANEEKAASLVEKAVSKGGRDNITCVVVSFA